jgi:hypothetical protein
LSFRRGDSNLTGIVLQKRRFKLDRDCPSEEEIQTRQGLSFRRGDSNLTEIVLQKRRFKLDRDCPSEEEIQT